MEVLKYNGWQFLCSGEQLPSGAYQAIVRYKATPDDPIRTLLLDSIPFSCSTQALVRAKDLAMTWAWTHPISNHE